MRALSMIGVLGGTFDPIHYGHLRPAQEASRRLGLRTLKLMPSAQPPHRPPPLADAGQRLRMAQLATAEFPGFTVDDREIRRGGPSYTVVTLESLRDEIGDEPLCLLLGADAFAGLPSWHRWESLSDLAHLVVLTRPGYAADTPVWARPRVAGAPAELAALPAGCVLFLAVTPQPVSASAVRETIAHGGTPPPDALPPPVWEYIRQHNLYRSLRSQ